MINKEKILQAIIICLITTVGSLTFSTKQALAKEINANEQQVIDTISGTFNIEGTTYKAQSSYISEVKNYLLSEEVDLTREQARELIQLIYSNVEIAVIEGYIILVDQPTSNNKEPTQTNETQKETNENQQETTNYKEEANENQHKPTKTNEADIEKITEELKTNENQQKTTIEDTPNNNESEKTNSTEPNITKPKITEENTDYKEQEIKISEHTETAGNNITTKIITGITTTIIIIIITVIINKTLKSKHNRQSKYEYKNGYIDIHTHILPGVDDGSNNMEETIKMLKLAYEQGIRTIIATPHYHINKKTTLNKLVEITKAVQKEAEKIDKNYRILLGNEIYYEEGCIEAIKQNKAATMAESRYVLIEFSPEESYQRIYNGLRDLIIEGYNPIIAHTERYRSLANKKEKIKELIQLGCYIQVNAESLKRSLLKPQTTYIRKLIKENLVHFIASDCHNTTSRSPNIEENLKKLKKKTTEQNITKMIYTNPSKIIDKKNI